MPRRDDRWLAWISGGVALAALPACIRVARAVPLHVPLDRNEGWNAYQAAAAFDGTLYPHPPHFFINNYPPLSFYIVGGLDYLIGDAIVTGRLVACAAFVALSAMLAVAARRLGCSLAEAMFAVVLFVSTTLALSHYVGIDDPQFLGQAVSTAALLILLRDNAGAAGIWCAAALMAAGVFTKHNVIALPIASVGWLWGRNRRAAIQFAVAGIGFATIGTIVCVKVFGPGFIEGMTTPRAYSLPVAVGALFRWIVRVPVFLGALALLVRRDGSDRAVAFCVWYVGVASAVGLVFLGGDGVDWNVMFESNWACCLTAAIALNRLAMTRRFAVAFLLLPIVASLLAVRRAQIDPRSSLAWRIAAAPATAQDIAFLARDSGPAVCEALALCYWADKRAEIDAFNLQQRVKHGDCRADKVAEWILFNYPVVQVSEPDTLFDRALIDALREKRLLARRGPSGSFWVIPPLARAVDPSTNRSAGSSIGERCIN